MRMHLDQLEEKILAFIDIGTNSIRLILVRLNPNHSYTVLRQEKEVVRLGENEFKSNHLQPEAMERAVLVCKKFAELAKSFGAGEIIAIATSAAREAKNQVEFLEQLKDEAKLEVRVIPGKEEARLIYLGVSSGVHIGKRKAIFIDIGGGSTELAIGDQFQQYYVDSFELGAIRLTTRFIQDGGTAPVPQDVYARMKLYIKNRILKTAQFMKSARIECAFGSSGTIVNLAEIAMNLHERDGAGRNLVLNYKNLRKVVSTLCALALDERKKIQGINPERADIIVGGAAILETIMEEFGLEEITISDRGIVHGMLMDYLSKHEGFPQFQEMSVREMSVLQLGRSCNINERHANAVISLALSLFDSSRRIGLHDMDERERELLKYSSFLHDIGGFIAFKSHHLHSHYIIGNTELPGFDQIEINIMANVARFHRKKLPKRKDQALALLDEHSANTVIILSMLLRLAEKLDRSHTCLVKKAEFTGKDRTKVDLAIWPDGGCELEVWGVESNVKAFEKIFRRKLNLNVIQGSHWNREFSSLKIGRETAGVENALHA
ncbi:MAG: Ppx/GppA phosphatase family protein [Candidatus Methanoperedens sp.]|nr:Ppx/GppA phosphatase family protein [Candidatus Methanoperedens sp.]MCZ7369552.1 Ppx/GppA phosphatase family protein [Candidatus Methanoperedens sp.]